jgi:hypothetical protein
MSRSSYKLLTLFIFPITLFSVGVLYIMATGPFFLKGVDPEYAYLFNGLLIADLKFNVPYIDHPGTPMQCIIALVIRTLHLFRPGISMVQDVLLNPEVYIRAVLYTVNVLNAMALLLLGYFTFRVSQNLVVALFMQLTPFTHIITLEVMGRMMPEPLMNIVVCGWLILMAGLIYGNPDKLNYKRYSVLFGFLFGISLADKLTFLPFFMLPLFLLPAWKNKLRYLFSSVFFFLVFAFPVALKIAAFKKWVTGIFLHTGNYGSGDPGIIKWNEFADHARLQYENTRVLFWVVAVLLFVTLICIVKNRKTGIFKDVKVRTGLALFLVIGFEYLMTAKHFAYHYMVPAILLTVLCILLIVVMLNDLFHFKAGKRIINGVLIAAGFCILFNIMPGAVKQVKQVRQLMEPKTASFARMEPLLKSSPKIISASYYGCAAIEYALTFGLHTSGKYGSYLFDEMKEIYPSTYLYFPWGKVFFEGNKEILPSSFIEPGMDYNLYVSDFSKERLDEVMTDLNHDSPENRYSIRQIYVDSVQHEGVFHVRFLLPGEIRE